MSGSFAGFALRVDFGDVASLLRVARTAPRPLVFTNGCFDILHSGHVRYLAEAAKLGAALWVGVNSDASVKRLKGAGRPVNGERERAEVLAALRSVTYVTIFDDDTPLRLIEKLEPDILVKGGDWDPKAIVGAGFVEARGGRVLSLPFHDGFSTTATIARVGEKHPPGGAIGTRQDGSI